MEKKQEPKIMQSSVTDEYYYVNKYKDLGNGHFESLSKRKATKEEIEEYLKQVKKQFKGTTIIGVEKVDDEFIKNAVQGKEFKTIKELEAMKLGEDRSYLNEGYLEALKDVVKLIDEMDWCENYDAIDGKEVITKHIDKEELKSKIEG